MRRYGWLLVALVLVASWAWQQRAPAPSGSPQESGHASPSFPTARDPAVDKSTDSLPPEARNTLQRIAHGGPFDHHQDGAIFQNREHLLPPRPRGYYREYTVETPGSGDRGARRIISGGEPPTEYFYSDDHYRSFRRVTPAAPGAGP